VIKIKLVKHLEEKEQLVKLFQISFNQEMSEKRWEWKYLTNPFATSSPEVVVAADNDRIVGARPFFLIELWINNERVIVAEHCDTMVHPDYRNQGIFNLMGEYATEYLKANRYALSFGFPGPMSRTGFRKQGYRKVVETEILFRLVNTKSIIAQRLTRQKVVTSLGYIYDKLLNTNKIPAHLAGTDDFKIEVFDKFTSDLENLDYLRNKKVIEFVRNEKSLRWRFDQHPGNTYTYISAKRNDRLSGYAVISVQKHSNDLVYGTIIDLVENEDISCFRALIKRAIIELVETGCDLIVIWANNNPIFQGELTRYWGFKSSARFPFNRMMDHGYSDVLALDEQFIRSPDIYNKDNWRITYAFADFT
jgi:GNAT superfamily N-acetyltransferase